MKVKVSNAVKFVAVLLCCQCLLIDTTYAQYHQFVDPLIGSEGYMPDAMSSWLAFMMGLYPNAGQSYYLINSPFVKQTTIHQENRKDFVITDKNFSVQNKFIEWATLNGVAYNKSWIEHNDIVTGGELVLEISPTA